MLTNLNTCYSCSGHYSVGHILIGAQRTLVAGQWMCFKTSVGHILIGAQRTLVTGQWMCFKTSVGHILIGAAAYLSYWAMDVL